MNARASTSRVLIILGALAMLVGALDPLEGSILILPGSGAIALGVFIKKPPRPVLRYWLAMFGLILFGLTAMFVLSSLGGIGGKSGRSMWWELLILPYPVGWLMALCGGVIALIRRFKPKRQTASA